LGMNYLRDLNKRLKAPEDQVALILLLKSGICESDKAVAVKDNRLVRTSDTHPINLPGCRLQDGNFKTVDEKNLFLLWNAFNMGQNP